MDVQEVRKLDAYLKRLFGNPKIRVVPRPKKDDSAEVYIGEEFIGVLFVDDEDDDRSFQFQMAILEDDLVEQGNGLAPAPCNCTVSRSIASATSRHCASQLRGKRNVRSAPSTRRSLRHIPGVARITCASGVESGRVGKEQIFIAVRRAVPEGAHRQAVLRGRRGLFEIARIDRAHPDIRRQRVVVRRYRQEYPVDRLHRGFFHGVGTDMPRRVRRL